MRLICVLVQLSKEGLLRPSLSQCRWEWDIERISERELPNDVVAFILQSISRLPVEVMSALQVLACFGSCTDCSLVEKIELELGLTLSGSLGAAVTEGIIVKMNEKYYFAHDRVFEAIFSLILPEERCFYHYKYGMALCLCAARENNDDLLLIAVVQVNLGAPIAITNEQQRVQAARLNLSAGKITMNRHMTDMFSAYSFFDHGISYLSTSCWNDNYELSLALHNGAVECALANGEKDGRLEKLSETIILNARCFDDKLEVLYNTMRKLVFKGDLNSVIELGLDGLSQLGESYPRHITPSVVTRKLEQLKGLIRGMSDDDLTNYKLMISNNPTKERAIMIRLKMTKLVSEASYVFIGFYY